MIGHGKKNRIIMTFIIILNIITIKINYNWVGVFCDIVGVSSYECPFQTPGSALMCSLWKTIRPITLPIAITLRTIGGTIQRHISMVWLPLVKALRTLLERIHLGIFRVRLRLPPIGLDIRIPRIGLKIHRRFRRAPPLSTQQGSPSPNPHDPPPPVCSERIGYNSEEKQR